MSLPTPMLDNRRFQDIVDEAKRLIPQLCPEWTDHNVSDPGIALIELFAWMTDMLLYRVNQVPEKVYIKFLELIGVKLDPPHSARALVTFYLSAPQPNDIVIPRDTEVATVRTETNSAIVFTTETDLIIRPPNVLGAFTQSASRGDAGWVPHDLKRLTFPNESIAFFPNPPASGDAFYLALEKDHSHHVIALVLGCDNAGGQGVDPNNPPIEWQVWQGGIMRWAPCVLEHDGTKGFNIDGEIILHVPAMSPVEFKGVRAYWLRCRLKAVQEGQPTYQISPELQRQLRVEARGGTIGTRHAVTVHRDGMGSSDGTPGQTFRVLNTPMLARDSTTDYLIVEPPNGEPEHWHEVVDFADSGPTDHHFTLDALDGTLTLGPALPQPDGSVYRFGAVPPKGSLLRFSRYQYGGGVIGNVPTGALSVLKSSIPYVAQVMNREPACGGRDPQSLEDAKLRAAQTLRTCTRAVTAGDYEYLTCQVPGVDRAHCLAPGAQPGDAGDPKPGQVVVIVLPHVESPQAYIPPDHLTLSVERHNAVLHYLTERCVLGCTVEVRPPEYTWVAVQAKLRLSESSDPTLAAEVQRRAEAELYRYLNPCVGGPRGDGWPFGRGLHLSEVYSILQRTPGVEFVEDVHIGVSDPGSAVPLTPATPPLVLPKYGVICSAEHRITIA